MKLENMLIRYGEPSKYDHAPYGTLCKIVNTIGDTFEMYVQVSEDDENPSWEKIGVFSDESDPEIVEEIEVVLSRKVNRNV